jgi:hypothetical protein
MRDKTRPAGIAAIGLGLLAALLFLAGPAAADPNGTNAEDGSVSSGAAQAEDGSVASGAAEAEDGSVSSGCAEAEDDSTASGGICGPKKHHDDHHMKPDHKPEHRAPGKVHHGTGGGGVGGAGPAQAVQTRSLAVTGSTTLPLALAGAALLGLGALMMVLTSDRRRAPLAIR